MLGVRQKQQQRKWRRQGEGAAPSSPTAALSLGRRETRPGLGGRREGGVSEPRGLAVSLRTARD